jgi:hypothetical protein
MKILLNCCLQVLHSLGLYTAQWLFSLFFVGEMTDELECLSGSVVVTLKPFNVVQSRGATLSNTVEHRYRVFS